MLEKFEKIRYADKIKYTAYHMEVILLWYAFTDTCNLTLPVKDLCISPWQLAAHRTGVLLWPTPYSSSIYIFLSFYLRNYYLRWVNVGGLGQCTRFLWQLPQHPSDWWLWNLTPSIQPLSLNSPILPPLHLPKCMHMHCDHIWRREMWGGGRVKPSQTQEWFLKSLFCGMQCGDVKWDKEKEWREENRRSQSKKALLVYYHSFYTGIMHLT